MIAREHDGLFLRQLSALFRVCYTVYRFVWYKMVEIQNIVYLLCLFLLTMLNPECWTSTADYHGWGGTAHRGITNLTICQEICISNPSCVAIDWEPYSPYNMETCWILTSPTIGPTTNPGTVTHYKLNRACQG